MEKERGLTAWVGIIFGIFLMTASFIILVVVGSGWAEITRLGLADELSWIIVFSLVSLVTGFLFIFKEKLDILNLGSERGTPVWAGIILSLVAIFCFSIGWLKNHILGYILGILFTFVLINGVFELGFEFGGRRSKAGKIIYLLGVAVGTIYFAFKNVNYLYISLGLFLALGGLVYFTRYGKMIKKYGVFQDKNLPLFAGIIIIVIIIIQRLFLS